MIIKSIEQVIDLKEKIITNAEKTHGYIKELSTKYSAIDLLFDMRFNKSGLDPIEGTDLNFVEQLNQMFSDLVVIKALEQLIHLYPGKQFEVNFGARSGFDIQSCDGSIVAECFAVTGVGSNNKLKKDAEKLMKFAIDKKKYIYFYSQNDTDEKIGRTCEKFSEISFVRIEKFID